MSADPKLTQRRRLHGHGRPLVVAAVLVSVATVGLWWALESRIAAQQATNALYATDVQQLDAQVKELNAIRARVESSFSDRQTAADWQAQREWPARLLRLLAESRPAGVRFEQVRDTERGVRLDGHARNYEELARLAEALDQSPAVDWLDVSSIRRDPAGSNLRFSLDVGIARLWRPLERPLAPALDVTQPVGDPK